MRRVVKPHSLHFSKVPTPRPDPACLRSQKHGLRNCHLHQCERPRVSRFASPQRLHQMQRPLKGLCRCSQRCQGLHHEKEALHNVCTAGRRSLKKSRASESVTLVHPCTSGKQALNGGASPASAASIISSIGLFMARGSSPADRSSDGSDIPTRSSDATLNPGFRLVERGFPEWVACRMLNRHWSNPFRVAEFFDAYPG